MKELFEKLHRLHNISSTNSKKQFIKANKDDKLFIDTLEFLLNPYKVTNISKKKIDKKVPKCNLTFEKLNDFYNYLTNDCTGKDSDIAVIQLFIEQNKEFETELKELTCKSMKLGVQGKLVNQALEYNLIPEFNVQLASKFEDKNIKDKEFIVTNKIDGIKCICIVENYIPKFYTRQGKLIEGLTDIENSIRKLNIVDFVLDGELYYNGEVKDSKDGYKKTMNNVSVKGEKRNLKYIVYDCLRTPEEFYNGRCCLSAHQRKEMARTVLKGSDEFIEYLEPLYIGKDSSVIPNLLKNADDNGEEGIIVSVSDSIWEGKRSKGCMKLKSFKDGEVYVHSIYPGEGRLEGKLGGVNAKFIYKDKVCDVKIGSGWLDADREYLINNPSKIVGSVISISYFEVTKNSKDKTYSLRFPTVTLPFPECIRVDKDSLEDTSID